jgi:hypothetical protein
MSINFWHTTRYYIPEDGHRRTHRRENFRSRRHSDFCPLHTGGNQNVKIQIMSRSSCRGKYMLEPLRTSHICLVGHQDVFVIVSLKWSFSSITVVSRSFKFTFSTEFFEAVFVTLKIRINCKSWHTWTVQNCKYYDSEFDPTHTASYWDALFLMNLIPFNPNPSLRELRICSAPRWTLFRLTTFKPFRIWKFIVQSSNYLRTSPLSS